MRTPVYTISGFLGAGKTTFLNGLLSRIPGTVNVAIIVNELGEIGIDGKIIENRDYLLREITQGCICCTLRGELADALIAIVEDNAPDFIILETTGVARPKQIVSDFHLKRLSQKVFSKGVITFLDAPVYARVGHKMPIINFQIEDADVIILNKIDLVDEETLFSLQNRLRSFTRDRKRIYETTYGKIEYGDLFPEINGDVSPRESERFQDSPEKDLFPLNHALQQIQDFHDSTEGFASISVGLDTAISQSALKEFFERHREKIIRAKGLLRTEKGNRLLHFSSSGLEMKDHGQGLLKSELVVIVKDQDRDAMKASLKSALDQRR